MTVELRKIKEEDANLLNELILRSKAYWGYSDKLMNLWHEELRISPEQIRERIGFVLEKEGELIGFWAREVKEELSEGHLFIDPKFMGQGYAKILWKALREELFKRNLRFITLIADPNAASFYKKLGAVEIGKKDSPSVPGRKLPVMRLPLSI